MAKRTIKRKSTPSALRKKKAQQRIRKKIVRKLEKKKPSWKAAIAKTYDGEGGRAGGKGKPKEPFGRKRPRDASTSSNATRRKKEQDEDEERSAPDDGAEVQSDVDEDRQERLNARDPLETQLFLKRLPLDTNEDELVRFFEARFGKVRRVLLVRNRVSKTLAGTGFVHCGSMELAEKIFAHAQQSARELSASDRAELKEKVEGLSHCKAKRMQFKMRTDAFLARDPFLTLRETRFTVHRVLSRTDSHEAVAALQKKKKRTKVAADDPRHLYLLQEGLIQPDTPAAKGLHPRYLEMIQSDYEARKAQLRNSNMFVSNTRLNVRNLPRTMGEKELRTLFATQVRSYLKQHKEMIDKERWGKYGPIRNVKIVKDSAGTSKGYAFLEFANHPIALHALRSVNNNPTLFGNNRRLIVSFAIEDINAIQKLKMIRDIRKQRNNKQGNKTGDDDSQA